MIFTSKEKYFSKILLRSFVVMLVFASANVFSQEKEKEKPKEEAKDQPAKTTESKPLSLPIISFGQGMLNFLGDIGYTRLNQPLTARSGFQIEIQPQTKSRLSISLFLLSGRVLGEEKTVTRSLNFKSSFVSQGIMLRYDFISRKREDQTLIPFITAGAEYVNFHSKTDLKDANGKYYSYWDDGTIKDIAQDDSLAPQAVRIYRDYQYETDLRDANLDGFGKYKTSTWGFPVGAGVLFRLSERCAINFSSVIHFTGTDYIDGITADGKGMRKGNSSNDKVVFSSVSIRFALSSPPNDYGNVNFEALANEDADGDGIRDLDDDSSGTPQHNPVYANGKPYDEDNDGIPDYRDEEPKSAADAVVNEQGVTITEEMIEEKFRKDSLAALPAVIEYLKSYDKLTQRNPNVEKKWIEKNSTADKPTIPIPPLYQPLDLDSNGFITPKEISIAIDDYLAKKSPYSVPEFFDLIDFFFSQN